MSKENENQTSSDEFASDESIVLEGQTNDTATTDTTDNTTTESTDTDASATEETPTTQVSFADFMAQKEGADEPAKAAAIAKPAAAPKTPRDYSIFPEADRPHYQRMSNEAFAIATNLYKENQQLKEATAKAPKAQPFYGHPKAYQLSDDYQQKTQLATTAQAIEEHWETQLAKVRRGEKWQDLDQDASGAYILSQPKEPTTEAEIAIGKHLKLTSKQAAKLTADLESFQADYGKTYQQDVQVIDGAKAKFFPGYENPNHVTRKFQDAILNALPASFRDHPVSQLLAMTGGQNSLLVEEVKRLNAELAKFKGTAADASKAPPTKAAFKPGAKPKGVLGVTMEDFRRAKEEAL